MKFFLFIIFSAILIFSMIKFIPYIWIEKSEVDMVLNVGFNGSTDLTEYDTRKVSVQYQATFLRNLFSPLVDYDLNAQLVVGLAERFYWEDDKLFFTFSSKSKTNSGKLVTAEDAAISLKRLIKDGANKHGDIGLMLCPNIDKNDIMGHCPGIEVQDNKLVLKVVDLKFKEFLLPLLASVDFRVIPKSSLDKDFSEIISFEETTGPYYVESYSKEKIILKANRFSYLYSEKMPQTVNLILIKGGMFADSFKKGIIDLIPTVVILNENEYSEILDSDISKIDVFKTFYLQVSAVVFSINGVTKFSKEERFYISSIVREMIGIMQSPFDVPTTQFFQDFGEGYLNKIQLQEIEVLRNNIKPIKLKHQPTIGIRKGYEQKWVEFFKKHKDFKPVIVDKSVSAIPMESRPDVYLTGTDVAFNSSPALLSYSLKEGRFGLYGKNAEIWFEDFLVSERPLRLEKLNELHFNALKNCYFYPISSSPFVAIARKPWSIHLNKFFAATNLWQIQKI
jgi:hypothetical protein